MTNSVTIYYDEREVQLKDLLQQLADRPDSPYYQRSHSSIARLLLIRALEAELNDTKSPKEETREPQA